MALTEGGSHGQQSRPTAFLRRLSEAAIGLAVGLGVDELSGGLGLEPVAVAAGVGAVLSATIWLRKRPRAPVVRLASRCFLVLAALAATVAAFAALGPRSDRVGPAVIIASVFAAAALMVSSHLEEGVTSLFGIAFVGAGVAVIPGGAESIISGDVAQGMVSIAVGAGFLLVGGRETSAERQDALPGTDVARSHDPRDRDHGASQ